MTYLFGAELVHRKVTAKDHVLDLHKDPARPVGRMVITVFVKNPWLETGFQGLGFRYPVSTKQQ